MRLFLVLALALALPPSDDAFVEDFSDPSLDGWDRVSSDAHPPYNTIETGRKSLRMATMGGSTSLRRAASRAWPVVPGRPYRLSVHARLVGTRRNTASAGLVWLDASGERLSEIRSALLPGPCDWSTIHLEIPAIPPGAVSAAPRLDFTGDDVRGECFFEKLALEPVELLDVRPAGRSYAIFSPEEYPRFTATLVGAPAGSRAVSFVLRSSSGAEVRRSAELRTPSDQPAIADFRAAPPGAYELTVSAGAAERRLTVLVAPGPASPITNLREWAGLPPTAPLQGSSDPLEVLLRRRLADPAEPVALDGRFLHPDGSPAPALLALRVTNEILAGAGPLQDPELFSSPVRTAAFRKGSSATLALWSESGDLELPLSLNPEAKICPLFGPMRPLRAGETLRLGPLPTFLTGVDPLLFELKLALTGGDLTLQQAPATRGLRFRNPPKSRPMSEIRVRVADVPPGWRVSPRAFSAPALAAGTELTEDLQIVLPPAEPEGTRELKFELAFTRDGREQVVQLSRAIRVRPALALETSVADGPAAGSRLVSIRIRNASDHPMTLALRARLPNLPEQNELVRDLAPGTLSRAFDWVVKDAALLDPTRASAEIDVQECLGDRAAARKSVPIR